MTGRRLATALLLLLLLASAADAQKVSTMQPAAPLTGTELLYCVQAGQPRKCTVSQLVSGQAEGFVTTNAALLTQNTTAFPSGIWRYGFAAMGDSPPVLYTPSNSACALNGGNGDNGGQVRSADGKCWILATGQRMVPEIWGAVGNGSTNDAPALNAALAYVGQLGGSASSPGGIVPGGTLYATSGAVYATQQTGSPGTITIPPNVVFQGTGIDSSQIMPVSGSTFTPVIAMSNRGALNDVFVNAGNDPNAVIIQMGRIPPPTNPPDYRDDLERVYTFGGCVGVDVEGASHVITGSFFYNMSSGANCGGVRVGSQTTGAATTDLHLSTISVGCTINGGTGFGISLIDTGGTYIGPDDDIVGCNVGTLIKPGANQQVAFLFCVNSAIGDTNPNNGLLIDTAAASAIVKGNNFVNCWTSGGGADGVTIQNTGGGSISGTVFIGHRTYGQVTSGFDLKAPTSGTISDTTISGSRICNVQNSGVDINLGVGVAATIQNNRIGAQCDGEVLPSGETPAYGVGLGGSNVIIMTGNDFSGIQAAGGTAVSGLPIGASVVGQNRGEDDQAGPTYPSASTLTLTLLAPWYHITGTTAIQTISNSGGGGGGWNGQQSCFISDTGGLTFGTSGNVASAIASMAVGGMVCGHYDGSISKWYLH